MAEPTVIVPVFNEDGPSNQPLGLAPLLTHKLTLNVDLEQREIYLHDEIEESDGPWFVICLRELERRAKDSPIRVLMSTPGGDVTAMFAIHDAIRATPCPVEVLAYGEVCSAGVLILACADRRLVTPSLALMSHESQGAEGGELGFRASRDRFKFREWQHRYWAELMGRYTPETAAWWLRKTERQAEYWLLGGDAIVAAGLADEVVGLWGQGLPYGFDKRIIPQGNGVSESRQVEGDE